MFIKTTKNNYDRTLEQIQNMRLYANRNFGTSSSQSQRGKYQNYQSDDEVCFSNKDLYFAMKLRDTTQHVLIDLVEAKESYLPKNEYDAALKQQAQKAYQNQVLDSSFQKYQSTVLRSQKTVLMQRFDQLSPKTLQRVSLWRKQSKLSIEKDPRSNSPRRKTLYQNLKPLRKQNKKQIQIQQEQTKLMKQIKISKGSKQELQEKFNQLNNDLQEQIISMSEGRFTFLKSKSKLQQMGWIENSNRGYQNEYQLQTQSVQQKIQNQEERQKELFSKIRNQIYNRIAKDKQQRLQIGKQKSQSKSRSKSSERNEYLTDGDQILESQKQL